MKVLFFVAFLAVLGVAYAVEECPKVDGEYAVSIANPANCGTFFACDSGVPILKSCPGDLEYNKNLGVCDWPENANCASGTRTTNGIEN